MNRRTLLASIAAAPLIGRTARAASAFVQTRDGQQLFYRDIGTGKPVLFVHGWTLSSAILARRPARLRLAEQDLQRRRL